MIASLSPTVWILGVTLLTVIGSLLALAYIVVVVTNNIARLERDDAFVRDEFHER
jgi:hypothetical protein